jgi:DNA-binding XRE family transcriptional regulator
MAVYKPHNQLKAIRARLGIAQDKTAAMLGISYPYFISVETGQRDLSRPLAAKVAKTFGVVRIQGKDAEPIIRNSAGALVPFTQEEYLRYKTARPSFFIEGSPSGQRLTPTAEDYARCARALLVAAEEQGTLRPVVADFVNWFGKSLASDAMFESLKRAFDRLFPGRRKESAAYLALTAIWHAGIEDEAMKWHEQKEKAAKRKREKKRRMRS